MIEKLDDGYSEFDEKINTCTHPEYKIPNMIVFQPGTYKHTCPACGKVTIFTIPKFSNNYKTYTVFP